MRIFSLFFFLVVGVKLGALSADLKWFQKKAVSTANQVARNNERVQRNVPSKFSWHSELFILLLKEL